MFSKLRKPCLILMTLTLFSILGCSDFLNGKKEEPKIIEISNTDLTCLKKLPSQLKDFSIGTGKKEDLAHGIDCLSNALLYFHNKTFGSVQGAYTAEEIRNFFNKYFLKENNLTPEFSIELMKIKKVIVGGTATNLTKEELSHLVDTLQLVKNDLVDLAPHIKILSFENPGKDLLWEDVGVSVKQLRKSLHSFLQKTQIVSSNYRLEDAKNAFAGFIKYTKSEQGGSYAIYKNWLPVLESVKKLLLGSNAHFADLYHWQENLDSFIDLYELALKRYYFFNKFEIDTELKLNHFKQFFNQAVKLLIDSHQMKTVGFISVESIDELIDQALLRTDISIRTKSLKKAYRFFLLKILNETKVSKQKMILGLEKKHLVALQRQFNIWWLLQSFINQRSLDKFTAGLGSVELEEHYRNFNASSLIENDLTKDPLEQALLQASWSELGSQILTNMPMIFNDHGQLVIDSGLNRAKQNRQSLTQANLMRFLSGLLISGYGQSRDGSEGPVITKDSLIEWYDDFRDLGLDLKAFDPRSANSGSRSFLEANLFTYHGNGDEFMDQAETYEFVSFLFSAGLSSAEKIRQDMISSKCAIDEKDVFGNPLIKENCFEKTLFVNFKSYFANLPGLAKFVTSSGKPLRDQLYTYLSQAAKVDGQENGYIETANIRTMVMILHYVESTMIVFDKDGNDMLSLDEVYSAAPRYLSFVKSVTDVKNEALLKQGFAYLVYNGTKPGAMDLLKFQWQKLQGMPEIQRLELLRLFSVLKDQLNKSKN